MMRALAEVRRSCGLASRSRRLIVCGLSWVGSKAVKLNDKYWSYRIHYIYSLMMYIQITVTVVCSLHFLKFIDVPKHILELRSVEFVSILSMVMCIKLYLARYFFNVCNNNNYPYT